MLCRGTAPQELQGVRRWTDTVAVYEIAFDPDEAVESFLPPRRSILLLPP